MNEYRDKLMQWKPGDPGFTRDEMILAVGLQCREKQFMVADVVSWLGDPDRATGSAAGGHLAYFYPGPNQVDPDDEMFYMFDISDGRVVAFGSVARFRNNAIRQDGKTHFNVLNEMEPFDEKAFT